MNLHIRLKPGVTSTGLANHIAKYTNEQNQSSNPKIRTWEVETVTLGDKTQIIGFKNSGQFYENGWIRMTAFKELIQADFVQNKNFEKTTEEQKAIIFTRFASMIRNHFGEHILTISLNGL